MAGLDALSSANASAQVAAAIDAEIAALAADAEALKGLLDVGSTARAVVLKSNGLTDLVQIVGQRVAASLPPDLKPGDVIYVQVTGFEDGHINLQIVPAPEGEPGAPAASAPSAGTATPSPVAPGTSPPATLSASGAAANLAPPAAAVDPPMAPPVSVFVAASVIRAVVDTAGPSPASTPGQPTAATGTSATASPPTQSGTGQLAQSAGRPLVDAAVAETRGAPSSPETALGVRSATGRPADIAARLAPPEPIEARIAALRAASAPPVTPPPVRAVVTPPIAPRFVPPPSVPVARPSAFVAPPFVRPSGTAAGEPPRITPGSPKPIGQGFASANSRFSTISPQAPLQARRPIENPVPIRTRGDAAIPDSTRAPGRAVPPLAAPAAAVRAAIAPTAQSTSAITAAAFRDPAVLLRALRVPVTQTNLASATLALQAPHRVPAALAALERALPDGRSDPRVATLRTIVGFIGRLDPQSPTLASQIAAYVSHVVDGGEPKLATLLQSYLAQAEPGATPTPTPGGANAPAAQATVSNNGASEGTTTAQSALVAAAPVAPGASVQPLAAAQTLIAQAAHEHDLKSTLQSLIAVAPSGAATPAAQTVLAAITGVQLDVASALAQSPQQVTFTIPLPLVHPDALAHVTIDRNRPDDAAHAIDGDNFHIAFILTTKHLGTVTIDLRTVGRAVNVGVHTEAELAAKTFGGALARLKDRLESLRYNVTSIESGVAPRADRLAQPERMASAHASESVPAPDEPHDVDKIA